MRGSPVMNEREYGSSRVLGGGKKEKRGEIKPGNRRVLRRRSLWRNTREEGQSQDN